MNAVIKAIVFFLVGITVVFYGGAYLLPGHATVVRSVVIQAPPQKVFAIAGNLRRVPDWSPWVVIDPKTQFSFEGPEQGGPGQVMRWASGNPLVGSGVQTVAEHVPDQRLVTESDYGEFGRSRATLDLVPEGNGTRVTWRFDSDLPGVIDRWAGLALDRSVGEEYDRGLARLKTLAEGG